MNTKIVENRDECHAEAACVQVFSMITASVSHEIKNVLAIINENGGLLDDLVLMGGPDQGVPPERVQSVTTTISRQVNRANLIMKNCNRLAHLGDKPLSQEPLAEIIELMAALAGRQADMKNISITTQCPSKILMNAPMLPFASLLYLLLQGIIDACEHDTSISLSAELSEGNITISCHANLSETKCREIGAQPGIKSTAERLNSTIDCKDKVIHISLSPDIC